MRGKQREYVKLNTCGRGTRVFELCVENTVLCGSIKRQRESLEGTLVRERRSTSARKRQNKNTEVADGCARNACAPAQHSLDEFRWGAKLVRNTESSAAKEMPARIWLMICGSRKVHLIISLLHLTLSSKTPSAFYLNLLACMPAICALNYATLLYSFSSSDFLHSFLQIMHVPRDHLLLNLLELCDDFVINFMFKIYLEHVVVYKLRQTNRLFSLTNYY